MSDKYIMYDPAEFDKIEIKPAENSGEITRLRAENERLREALKETLAIARRNEAGDYVDRARAIFDDLDEEIRSSK